MFRRARKEHTCSTCKGTIQVGEVHEAVTYGPWIYQHPEADLKVGTARTCLPCLADLSYVPARRYYAQTILREWQEEMQLSELPDEVLEHVYSQWSLYYEDLSEAIPELHRDEKRRLTALAVRQVLRHYDQTQKLVHYTDAGVPRIIVGTRAFAI